MIAFAVSIFFFNLHLFIYSFFLSALTNCRCKQVQCSSLAGCVSFHEIVSTPCWLLLKITLFYFFFFVKFEEARLHYTLSRMHSFPASHQGFARERSSWSSQVSEPHIMCDSVGQKEKEPFLQPCGQARQHCIQLSLRADSKAYKEAGPSHGQGSLMCIICSRHITANTSFCFFFFYSIAECFRRRSRKAVNLEITAEHVDC